MMSIFQKAMAVVEAERKIKAIAEERVRAEQERIRRDFVARSALAIARVEARFQVERDAIVAGGGAAGFDHQLLDAHYVMSMWFSFAKKRFDKEDVPVFDVVVRVDGEKSVSLIARARMSESSFAPSDLAKFKMSEVLSDFFDGEFDKAMATIYVSAAAWTDQRIKAA